MWSLIMVYQERWSRIFRIFIVILSAIIVVSVPFTIPPLECCAPVCSSAAACHLQLDRVMRTDSFLCELRHLCDINNVCIIFYSIRFIPFHPLHHSFSRPYVPARNTILASSLHLVYSQFVATPSVPTLLLTARCATL